MSLVAEYDSGSESDTGSNKEAGASAESESNGVTGTKDETSFKPGDHEERIENEEQVSVKHQVSHKLPSASSVMDGKAQPTSVWSNEYKKDEEEKQKALEQHVKMVDNKRSIPVNGKVNGKKVCWMYNRGRCRLGRKCQMYHDSELRTKDADLRNIQEKMKQPGQTNTSEVSCNQTHLDVDCRGGNNENDGPKHIVPKKRLGLGDNIVPSKKVLQHFEAVSGNKAKAGQ